VEVMKWTLKELKFFAILCTEIQEPENHTKT
jgi:hypothetical protein